MDTSDDPITLMIIGTSIGAAGILQQGQAAAAEAQSAQNIANYNAAVQEREATAIRQKTAFAQQRQAKRGERVKSSLQAALAKAGGIGAGTPLQLESEQAAELELENLLIGYEGEVGAKRALTRAEQDRMQGKLYAQKGKNLKTASYFKAGSTLLTGFGGAFT
jgi:hypothetical protein